MALNSNPFDEGIDPTSTFGGYASVLLQLIREAKPSSTYGMILFDTTAPDVTGANAWRKRSIWISLANPAQPTVNVYRETSPGWFNVNDIISPNTIETAMIKNLAVTLAKLSPAGGTANQLIRVNAGATAFEFVSLSSLVVAGSINVNSLITTGIPAGQFRLVGTYGPGVATWYDAQQVVNNLANAAIPTDLLTPAPSPTTRSKFLTGRVGDVYATWRFFEPNTDILDTTLSGGKLQNGTVSPVKVESAGIPDGYLLGKVAGVPDWVAPTTVTGTVIKYASAQITLPAVGAAITPLNHGLSGQPINVYGVLVCVIGERGYIANDELPLSQVYHVTSSNEKPIWYLHATTTQIHCIRSDIGTPMITADATTGNAQPLTDANWRLKFYALI